MKQRKNQEMKKLMLVLTREQHAKLKSAAAAHGMSMKSYVVEKAIESGNKKPAKKLPDFRAQLDEIYKDNPPKGDALQVLFEERDSYQW